MPVCVQTLERVRNSRMYPETRAKSKSSFCASASIQNISFCVHPCPCGFYGDTQKPCTPFGPRARRGGTAWAHALVTKSQKRIAGPLLDRIGIHIEVPRVDYEKLSGDQVGESSELIRARVQAARNIQQARFTNPEHRLSNYGSSADIVCNADMRVGEIRQYCKLPEEGQSLMRAATSCIYRRGLTIARKASNSRHDCGPGRLRGNTIRAFGGSVARFAVVQS